MAYLFIDTTSNLKIGILSEDCRWIELHHLEEKKPSEVIHKIIYESLLKHDLSLDKITKVIACAGPGSYTGMRLSEGIVQVLELSGIHTLTFYHFDLPLFLGIKKYIWVATAFKGEYFIFQYDQGNISKTLVLRENLAEALNQYKEFEKYALVTDPLYSEDFKFTSQEIVDKPEKYIPKVIERDQRDQAYYYRTVEEEFKIK